MGIDVTVFEGICYIYDNGDLYTEPIGNDDCYSLSENNVWVGFGNEYICDDNEDVLLLLLNQNTLDETELQMIDDAGGPCNYVIPMAIGDPLIQNLCCETLSNTDPLSGVIFSGAFGGTYADANTYTMPSGSESWAGFANEDASLYPYTFGEGGSITLRVIQMALQQRSISDLNLILQTPSQVSIQHY